MVKENNQSSVSDADREITTLGSTDNAENSVNLPTLSVYLRVGISLFASETDDRFYFISTHVKLNKNLYACENFGPTLAHCWLTV